MQEILSNGANVMAFIFVIASAVIAVLKWLLPENPVVNTADRIISYAKIGVGNAEQLYMVNQITGPERKEEASEFVYSALNAAKIRRNAEIDEMVNGAIEAAVLALGHKRNETDDSEGYGAV